MSDHIESDQREPIEYVLGDLTAAQREAFEARLRVDAELREQVSEVESLFVALRDLPEDSWQPVEPPPLAPFANGHDPRSPLLRDRDESPGEQDREHDRNRERPRGLSWRVPALAAAGLALLGAGLVIGSGLGDDTTQPSEPAPPVVATSELKPVDATGSPSRGEARLLGSEATDWSLDVSVSGLTASRSGNYYEMWLMSENGDLVSLGGFKVGKSGRRNVEVPLPADPADFNFIDVSLERDDGDPGHSSVSVLRGPA